MRIVAAHTTIPIPKVIDLLDNDYILMTGLPGDTLGLAFYDMDERQVEHVRKSLWKMMQQLQDIPQHAGANGVICGPLPTMPCCDVNRVEERAFGPFPDLASFHKFLQGHGRPKESTEEREKMLCVHSKPQRIVFTHGDLNLSNILYENGEITGIIDWTCAGWYPAYWELGKAVYVHRNYQKWRETCRTIWSGYDDELDVEIGLWMDRN
jgi:aminoglycoside phosphotransferase (APT) family kinase protein